MKKYSVQSPSPRKEGRSRPNIAIENNHRFHSLLIFWIMLSFITHARFERAIEATSSQQLNTSAKPNQLSEFEAKVICRQWPFSYSQSFARSLLSQKLRTLQRMCRLQMPRYQQCFQSSRHHQFPIVCHDQKLESFFALV